MTKGCRKGRDQVNKKNNPNEKYIRRKKRKWGLLRKKQVRN